MTPETARPADAPACAPAASTQCALCGSMEVSLVQTGVRYLPEASVRACSGCGLVFLWPRPGEQELAAYYQGAYREEYDGKVSPNTTHQKVQSDVLERARRLAPLSTPAARVLEIGSGSGALLEAVRPHAASVVGVEPGTAHREWANQTLGIETVERLQDLGQRRFTLIGLFHVLEHVPDPVGFLKQIVPYLAPGGTLAIEVPNVTDALLAVYDVPAFPAFYFQRAHLSYFSAATLSRTVEAAGGRAAVTSFQRYDLSNHLRWLQTGQPGGQGYYRQMLGEETETAYAQALIRAGHADTLWATASFAAGSQ